MPGDIEEENIDSAPEEYSESVKKRAVMPPMGLLDNVPADVLNLFSNILKYRVDPTGKYYGVTRETLIQEIGMINPKKIQAMDSGVEDFNYIRKGEIYDRVLQSFVQGCGGEISSWREIEASPIPAVIRGITKHKEMQACREVGRDFYYIDTGYFGNSLKQKLYHRVTLNDVQNFGPVKTRPHDRLRKTWVSLKKNTLGRSILLAPPSQKLLNIYKINADDWIEQTLDEIKKYTDRPIIVRHKQSRTIRMTTDTIEMALDNDIHCLVTHSSIAAVEALMNGKPAITLGPNAASSLCSHSLSEIENPYRPSMDEVRDLLAHLSYCQFTEAEMRNGTAWAILNE